MQTANQLMAFNRKQLSTIRPRDVRRMQERDGVTSSMENIIDAVVTPITKVRTIVFRKAGDGFRAHFQGRSSAIFVYDKSAAAKRLAYFDSE